MRSSRHCAACIGVGVMVASGALGELSLASASSVTVRLDREFQSSNEVYYAADPGESNDVVIAYASDARTVTVTDPGATIRPVGSCSAIDDHTAICHAPSPEFPVAGSFLQRVRVELGDLDDRAVTTRPGPALIGGIDVDGGPGADELTGSPTNDALAGGGGRDVLRGGAGVDQLSDGDRDGAPGDLAPGADVLDGGAGRDELSYSGRTRGVRVDLADQAPDGALGENDALIGIESVIGGGGDDRLLGDRSRNLLDGGGGRNRLIGRGGDDTLQRPSARAVSCGAGRDVVTSPRATTRIPVGCERLLFRLPPKIWTDDEFLSLTPYPERRRGRLGFDIRCPQIDGVPLTCSATIHIRERTTGRLIGTGSAALRGEIGQRFLGLTLTPLGERLQHSQRQVSAITSLRGRRVPRTRWTTRFPVRRIAAA